MKQFFLFSATLLCMLCVACSDNEGTENGVDTPRKDIVLSRSQQDIVDSQARFAFDYFKAVSEWKKCPDNVVISPLSLSYDLAILANGAGEQTYADIMTTIKAPNTTPDELNSLYRMLTDELLKADGKVKITIANALWNRQEFPIRDEFSNCIAKNYDAVVEELDFHNQDKVKSTINHWASDKTNGKITKVISDGTDLSDYMFILCNALYFNGEWATAFDKAQTKKMAFTNIDGSESSVMTMTCDETSYSYIHNEVAEVVKLPYGNGAFSMYVILPGGINENPKDQQDLDQFITGFDYDWWVATKANMLSSFMRVYMPKFKVETKCPSIGSEYFTSLKPITETGKYNLMSAKLVSGLSIDQYNTIEVTESGTEAAAVTTTGGYLVSLPGKMHIDHPFIYLIEEQSTGTILFMGKVTKL